MTDKERDILESIAEALPKMSERSKGYFLGYAEATADRKSEEEQDREEDK